MTHRTQVHREIELKFELDRRSASKIRRNALLSKVGHHTNSQKSVYFDTDDGKVHRAGYSLRVRQDGRCFTQTVKTNGGLAGLFDRGEWEAPVECMAPDADALKHSPLRKFKKLRRKLKPVIRSDVARTTWLIDLDASIIEVVLDSGTVASGDREVALNELELELKRGEAAALFNFAQQLGQAVPLQVGVLSKEARGRMLAQDGFSHEQKASAVDILEEMDAGQAFASIVQECIRHFRLNEALIIEQLDPGALHQARVAIRRLRTAFTLFRPAIQQGPLKPLQEELRAFIGPFGEARNLDVFGEMHACQLSTQDRRKLTLARSNAYQSVSRTLNAQRSRDMFLDLLEWTTSGSWRTQAASSHIRKFAAHRLEEVWKKAQRKGSTAGDLDEKHLHELRINIKKLRYAVEFLAPLYARKRVRKFVSALEELQDRLGLIHDDMVSRQIVSDFELDHASRPNVADRSLQLKAVAKRLKQLNGSERFWVG